ncbi:MAG: helicase-exonuclease AddAB subunit AddA [Clostridiales bacterium]|nr:helicase-exonuclease AddAB subunit AddA [Clostridiales bacterium]
MKFTVEQQRAIDTIDKNVLVSAAAGSGKTAVLVERIIKILLKGQSSIDNMLIVTFTNAAASEIKAKVIKAIKKEMQENPSKRSQLSRELDAMYRSYISTFHSFAMRIIKEFFYTIDMEPNFKICDEAQSAIMENDVINELFEEGFNNDGFISGGSFIEFLETYSSDRNENWLMDELVSNYHILRSIPDYFDWADSKIADMCITKENVRSCKLVNIVKINIKTRLGEAVKLLDQSVSVIGIDEFSVIKEKIIADKTMIQGIIEETDNILSINLINSFDEYKFQTLSAPKDKKNEWEDIKPEIYIYREKSKAIVKDVKEKYFCDTIENQLLEISQTAKYAGYYIDLLKKFEVKFQKKKQEANLMDFSDIEHVALKILKNQEVADTFKERLDFIFIDEYQDTNYIQESLIAKISRDNNLFKVGDVKQSIYKFRQAEPQIFINTRAEYSKKENIKSTIVDLNNNFRSKGKIIDYINTVFEKLMNDYDDAAKLYEGIKYDGEYNDLPEVHIVNMDKEQEGIGDDEHVFIDKIEVEARATADFIRNQIGKDFHDSKNDVVRPLEPKDIVILMRSTKRYAEVFYKELLREDIQAYISDDDGYFNTIEINLIIELLSFLDNMKQDTPMISVLYSEMFSFTTEELGKIRAFTVKESPYIAYHQAFNIYSSEGDDERLRQKCNMAMEKLHSWKNMSGLMTLDKFIWRVIIESNYYLYIGAMPRGKQRQANLRALVDKAIDYQNFYSGSLHDFVNYLNVLKTKQVRTGQAKIFGEDDNLVRIMTIHKSKGLEFPCVILAGLGKKLMQTNLKSVATIHSGLGIGITRVDRDKNFKRKTILQKLIADALAEEGYQEELRILYVAMTRAREKLILMGLSTDIKEDKGDLDRSKFITILGQLLHSSNNKYLIESGYLGGKVKDVSSKDKIEILLSRLKNSETSEGYDDVLDRLSYDYPYDSAVTTKSKYSVSELTSGEHELEETSMMKDVEMKVPEFAKLDIKVKGAEIGNAYHKIMELIDFYKVDTEGISYVEKLASDLTNGGVINGAVLKNVNLQKIMNFINSDIGQRCVKAFNSGLLFREQPFTMIEKIGSEDVLVQGIADCYFYEGDDVILLDYKSNTVKESIIQEELDKIKERYTKQIDIYQKALESGLNKKISETYLYLFSAERLIEMI